MVRSPIFRVLVLRRTGVVSEHPTSPGLVAHVWAMRSSQAASQPKRLTDQKAWVIWKKSPGPESGKFASLLSARVSCETGS